MLVLYFWRTEHRSLRAPSIKQHYPFNITIEYMTSINTAKAYLRNGDLSSSRAERLWSVPWPSTTYQRSPRYVKDGIQEPQYADAVVWRIPGGHGLAEHIVNRQSNMRTMMGPLSSAGTSEEARSRAHVQKSSIPVYSQFALNGSTCFHLSTFGNSGVGRLTCDSEWKQALGWQIPNTVSMRFLEVDRSQVIPGSN